MHTGLDITLRSIIILFKAISCYILNRMVYEKKTISGDNTSMTFVYNNIKKE